MANDVDAGDALVFTLAGQPSGMTMSPSGAISWRPTGAQVGTYTITVNVSDKKDPVTAQFKVTVMKKKTASWFSGSTVLMLGILVAIIAAVIIALVVMMLRRGRKKEEPAGPTVASRPEPDKPGVQFEVVDMDEMNEPKVGPGQEGAVGQRPRPVQRKQVKKA
jgi:flagellar biosynthesis/type III secretory pathway M-ring protein FliF/YscJ